MPLITDYPLVRPRPRFAPEEAPDLLTVGLGIAAACITVGLFGDTFTRLKLKTKPKPQPCNRVSVYDLNSGQVLLWDVPYVLEERWDNHQYFFKFRGGGERFLDLRGHNYRIVRREA